MAETSFSGENTAEMPSGGTFGRSRMSEAGSAATARARGGDDGDSTCRHFDKSDHRMGKNGTFFDEDDDEVAAATDNTSDSRFACNICLEAVAEPVVTPCGHLYCWSCLYKWLEPGLRPDEVRFVFQGHEPIEVEPHRRRDENFWDPVDVSGGNGSGRRCCPVCKKECGVRTLIPIYVRNDEPVGRRKTRRTGTKTGGERLTGASAEVNAASLGLRRRRGPGGQTPNDDRWVGRGDERGEDHSVGGGEGHYPATTPEHAGEGAAGGIDSHSSSAAVPSRPLPPPPPAPSSSQSPNGTPRDTTPAASVRDLSLPERTRSQHERSTSSSSSSSFHQPLFQALLGFHAQSRHRAGGDGGPSSSVSTADGSEGEGGGNASSQFPSSDTSGGAATTVEDATTEFLSRLLLMLGSFVVLCLLLF